MPFYRMQSIYLSTAMELMPLFSEGALDCQNDLPYLFEKVKFVPKIDIPYYAIRYFGARIYRLISKESRLGFWA